MNHTTYLHIPHYTPRNIPNEMATSILASNSITFKESLYMVDSKDFNFDKKHFNIHLQPV